MRTYVCFLTPLLIFLSGMVNAQSVSVLVFSKTAGFRHSSIETGIQTIRKLGEAHDFSVFASEDSKVFTDAELARFDVIVLLNTTGDIFSESEQNALKAFVRSGKGIVGVHAATDTEFEWPWYGKMMGAYFTDHPSVQQATLIRHDSIHPTVRFLPVSWQHKDEWYNFRDIQPGLQVLITLDEQSYNGGKNGEFHPIAWCHEFEGGRIFYTGFGHLEETYRKEWFRQHLLMGIRYASGNSDPF